MIDWKKTEERLFNWSQTTIKKFARTYSDENICAIFFDSEPQYGYVILAFDTLENSLKSAQQLEKFSFRHRQVGMDDTEPWRNARIFLSPFISLFNTDSGDFAYSQFANIQFPAWQRLVESKNYEKKYPKRDEDNDDYLEGNVRIVLWRVMERLVATQSFRPLKLAHPFFVGYAFHDQEPVILRVINWPA